MGRASSGEKQTFIQMPGLHFSNKQVDSYQYQAAEKNLTTQTLWTRKKTIMFEKLLKKADV